MRVKKSYFFWRPKHRKNLFKWLALTSAIALSIGLIANTQEVIQGIKTKTNIFQNANSSTQAPSFIKSRVVVMTDIGDDPDDQQSMVRFLSYANDFDIEGITVTPLYRPGRPNSVAASMAKMDNILNAYGTVHSNLVLHDPTFPAKDYLKSVRSEE